MVEAKALKCIAGPRSPRGGAVQFHPVVVLGLHLRVLQLPLPLDAEETERIRQPVDRPLLLGPVRPHLADETRLFQLPDDAYLYAA